MFMQSGEGGLYCVSAVSGVAAPLCRPVVDDQGGGQS